MKRSDTIIIHDAFAFKGGGERLTHILCQGLKTDLAFGFRNKETFNLEELPGQLINLNSESKLPFWRTFKRLHTFYQETKFLSEYKNVIYTGQNSSLAVSNHPEGKNIYYCFTPPRSIYDLKEVHLKSQSPIMKLAHIMYKPLFQPLYENAIRKMDVIVADSKNVQNRIQKFLGLDSIVVYPPCDTKNFSWLGQEDYYLSMARLVPYKRVDIIIEAFKKLPGKRLIVSSAGPEEKYLKQLAEGFNNIHFTGDVSEQELQKLIGNAIATIYIARDEDFGMSPVESMAAGKPVIGVGEGGLLETLIHDQTGLLLSESPSHEELVDAVQEMDLKKANSMRSACESRARRFRKEIFIDEMKKITS